jgi:hypothetical protein
MGFLIQTGILFFSFFDLAFFLLFLFKIFLNLFLCKNSYLIDLFFIFERKNKKEGGGNFYFFLK